MVYRTFPWIVRNIKSTFMDKEKFKVIIVEDVKLELKGTQEIFRHEIPDAEVIGYKVKDYVERPQEYKK